MDGSGTVAPARRRRSRHRGAAGKMLVGCLVLLALGVLGTAAAIGVGGFALMRGMESAFGGLDEHQEASRLLDRLDREHPFQPPVDGAVAPELAHRFRAVTLRAWEGMRPWAAELRARSKQAGGSAGDRRHPSQVIAGTRVFGGVTRSRLVVARALSREGSSLGEYVWTGHALARCDSAFLSGPPWDDADPAVVLDVATLWAMAEPTMLRLPQGGMPCD